MFKKIKRYTKNPYYALGDDMIKRYPHLMSDKFYLSVLWKMVMGYELDWEHPKTFCEKLQWLKLNDHNPLYHKLVDKYEVKNWVAERIGSEYVAKTYALYDSVDEINFDFLPDAFVLKCTHNSGSIVVCPDKSKLDRDKALELLSQGMAVKDFYRLAREWAYKGVKPRIIAEEYMDTLGKPESIEYKLTCINGKVMMTTVCSGIAHAEFDKRFNDHFDKDGNRMPFVVNYQPAGLDLPPQPIYDKLVEIAEILSVGIPQVRVDMYVHHDKIIFGEMTFYTWGGFMNYVPKEYDRIMGDWIKLPTDK